MGIDWHRVAALPIFGGLAVWAFSTGSARLVLAAVLLLVWPFVFVWWGDDLAQTAGLHFGLVDRPSNGAMVRFGGWVILAIYLVGIAHAVAATR